MIKVRSELGLTQAEVAKRLSSPLRTYQRWEQQDIEHPSVELLTAYVKLGVDLKWLITGKEPTTKTVEPPPLLVQVGSEAHQKAMEGMIQDYRAIPFYESGRLAAGRSGWEFNDSENPESMVVVYRPELRRHGRAARNLVAVRVGGDSMEPTIPRGSIVVIDQDDRAFVDRKIWCVRPPDGQTAVKRLRIWSQGFVLVSDNPEYPPEPVAAEWPDLCVGRVIWQWRTMEEA